MQVRFARRYDHDLPNGSVVSYEAGSEHRVTAEVHKAAVAAGAVDAPVDEPTETK